MATVALSPVCNGIQYFDNNGKPLSGGLIFQYEANSTTVMQTTYADTDGAVPNENPIVLDSSGRIPTEMWMEVGKFYNIVITKPDGTTVLFAMDDITGTSGGGGGGGSSHQLSIINYGADPTGVNDSWAAIKEAMVAASTIKSLIYIPSGIYKVSGPLTNDDAPNLMGIVGDTGTTSILDFSEANTDGIIFTDPPAGTIFRDFLVIGPGQFSIVNASGFQFVLDQGNNVYGQEMTNVRAYNWPTMGFKWVIPIVSTFTNLVAQECGDYGFAVGIKTAQFVGGTSTAWQGCYANNVLGSGFRFQSHGYANLTSCAADNCNIGYDMEFCFGAKVSNCGSEVNTYVDDNHPGIGVYIKDSYSCSVEGLWTYNMPNVLSRQILLDASSGCVISAVSGYTDNGVSPTFNAAMVNFCESNQFLQNYHTLNDTPPNFYVSQFFTIDKGDSVNTTVLKDGQLEGVEFDVPDQYGNSFYVRNGALVVSADPGVGALNLFQTALFDYPVLSVDNTGIISFGDGTAPADTNIQRAGPGALFYAKARDYFEIQGSNHPQLGLNNTGNGQQWAISADNGGGIAIYDATHGVSTGYFYPANGGTNSGMLQLDYGLDIEGGGRIFIKDYGNSASGEAIFPATSSLFVPNTLITANSRILVTILQIYSGSPHLVWVSSRSPGSGFTLEADGPLDASVAYLITEPF